MIMSNHFTFRFDDDDRCRLERLARARAGTRSDTLRWLIRRADRELAWYGPLSPEVAAADLTLPGEAGDDRRATRG